VVKKAKKPVKSVAKPIAVKKAKKPAKSIAKPVAVKKTKKPAKSLAKTVAVKKLNKPAKRKEKAKSPVSAAPVNETITHGEDLHLIPAPGELHPIRTLETHQLENTFHHKEEVAFQREKQKMIQGNTIRRIAKRVFRNPGHRS